MTNEEILDELCKRGLDKRFKSNPRTVKSIGNLVKCLISQKITSTTPSREESIRATNELIGDNIQFDSSGNPTKACIRVCDGYFEYYPQKWKGFKKGEIITTNTRIKMSITDNGNIVSTVHEITSGPGSKWKNKICFMKFDAAGNAKQKREFSQTLIADSRAMSLTGVIGATTDTAKENLKPIKVQIEEENDRKTYKIFPQPADNKPFDIYIAPPKVSADASSIFNIGRLLEKYGNADQLPSIDDICKFLSFFNGAPLKYEECIKDKMER